jgi:hypothetical protein
MVKEKLGMIKPLPEGEAAEAETEKSEKQE